MITIAPANHREVDELAWLEIRRTGVGGSDLPVIVGLRPGIRDLYRSKIEPARLREPGEVPLAAEIGRDLEPLIARRWAAQMGARLAAAPMVAHDHYSWAHASPDRYLLDEQGQRFGGLEIKRPAPQSRAAWRDGPPPWVVVQCAWYQWITQLHRWWVAWMIGDSEPRSARIPYDRRLVERLIDAAWRFWRAVEDRRPPIPIHPAEVRQELAARDRRPDQAEATERDTAHAQELLEIRRRRRKLEDRERDLENRLIRLMGEGESVRGDDWGASYRPRRGRIAWRALAEELAQEIAGSPHEAAILLEERAERHRRPPARTFHVWRRDP